MDKDLLNKLQGISHDVLITSTRLLNAVGYTELLDGEITQEEFDMRTEAYDLLVKAHRILDKFE